MKGLLTRFRHHKRTPYETVLPAILCAGFLALVLLPSLAFGGIIFPPQITAQQAMESGPGHPWQHEAIEANFWTSVNQYRNANTAITLFSWRDLRGRERTFNLYHFEVHASIHGFLPGNRRSYFLRS